MRGLTKVRFGWSLLYRAPGGHKYFEGKVYGETRIGISDDSGYLPDETDDGVLYFNPQVAKIHLNYEAFKGFRATMEVYDLDGEKHQILLNTAEVNWLVTCLKVKIGSYGGEAVTWANTFTEALKG